LLRKKTYQQTLEFWQRTNIAAKYNFSCGDNVTLLENIYSSKEDKKETPNNVYEETKNP
jgi:hypothetical protein